MTQWNDANLYKLAGIYAQNTNQDSSAYFNLAERERKEKEKQRQIAAQAAAKNKVQSLIGQPKNPYQMSEEELFPNEAPIQGLMNGSGLLGGEVTPQEFYSGLLSTDGYQNIGAQGLMNIVNNSNMLAKQQLIEDSKKQQMYGNFKDYDQYLKARQSLRKEWQPQLAPSRESIRKFNQATDIIEKKNGFNSMNGADDTVLIKAFASMILPGEAVMEGDIATIVNQNGLPGTIQSYLQAFKGEGQLGVSQRQEIYNAMTGLAKRANSENLDIRNQMSTDIKEGGINSDGLFRSPLQFQPFTVPNPPGKVLKVIK